MGGKPLEPAAGCAFPAIYLRHQAAPPTPPPRPSPWMENSSPLLPPSREKGALGGWRVRELLSPPTTDFCFLLLQLKVTVLPGGVGPKIITNLKTSPRMGGFEASSLCFSVLQGLILPFNILLLTFQPCFYTSANSVIYGCV